MPTGVRRAGLGADYDRRVPEPRAHLPTDRPLGRDEARDLAETLQAFSTASRLGLLWALLGGERPVDELAELVELSPSAASHQLRILRQARLVSARRDGRRVFYRLHDHHLPDLLAAMRHHHEHVHGGHGRTEGPAAGPSPSAADG